MDSLCRLCSVISPALSSIFSFKNDRLISDMITILCPIKIDPSDDYPKNICRSCLKIITDCYELREKCVMSDINFRTEKIIKMKQKSAQKEDETPKSPEILSIKVEKDPFTSSIEFEEEIFVEPADEEYDDGQYDSYSSDEDQYFEETIPMEPNFSKISKYEMVTVEGVIRYKCPRCEKSFTHQTNVKRHLLHEHENKKPKVEKRKRSIEAPKPKEIPPTSCKFCGKFISHQTNLRRHIKLHHPEHYRPEPVPNPHLKDLIEGSSEIARRFLDTPTKQKYLEYFNVLSISPDNCYRYQCLVCIKETGKAKVMSQSINNGNTSNMRRHLSTMHPDEFTKFEIKEKNERLNFYD